MMILGLDHNNGESVQTRLSRFVTRFSIAGLTCKAYHGRRQRQKNLDTWRGIPFQSQVPPCLRCGRHSECRIGGLYMMLGEDALSLKIKPEMFKRWEDDPASVAAVEQAARKLRDL